ncbi:DUF1667 domain-containing protein [Paludicola sp. MB14-C6]|uniref:DUF1667 domain-containing protein n=1 Tax=Paludihabitans sp. MB14-C6 TaxID=3070656 RepID=UPI0027DBDD3C|nr:DUF1667 domain-containing protein [Paludicola sp. MB14-C6]WMJ22859.1 DUF1667 domain-containing protein [Paludicola sp. MB14-C6]
MNIVCIVCPNGCCIEVNRNGDQLEMSGNLCERGRKFVEAELTNPTRSLTTTMRSNSEIMPVIPVRTDGEIPKDMMFDVMAVINQGCVKVPVKCGDIVVKDILGTGCNMIATCSVNI